jgi:hypothetical protein
MTLAEALQTVLDELPIDMPAAQVLAVRRAYLRGHSDQLSMRKAGKTSDQIGAELAQVGRNTGRAIECVR